MITSLIKATARTTADAVQLLSRPGLWLTRRLFDAAIKPQREGSPEPVSPPTPREGSLRTRSPTAPTAETPRTSERPRAAETRVSPAPAGVPGRDVPPERPVEPHDALNTPVGEPDPTEWPDPYDRRADPRDPNPDDPIPIGDVPHTPTGAQSTSAPHPDQDPEAIRSKAPERDKLDE